MRNRVDYYERTDYTMFTVAEIFELFKGYLDQLAAIIKDAEVDNWFGFIKEAAAPLIEKFGNKEIG